LISLIKEHPTVSFWLLFAILWVVVSTVIFLQSGWFRLTAVYPDEAVEPILVLRGQAGTLRLGGQTGMLARGIRMVGVLNLRVCPTGLRVGIKRLFGLFCRDFLVPWEHITITRKANLFLSVAELRFGTHPLIPIGTLTIPAHVADRLALAAPESWPEDGPFFEEKRGNRARRFLAHWAAATLFGSLFFSIPSLVSSSVNGPAIWFAFLFPGIFFGIAFAVTFLRGDG
jgi:hypothetical protein